MLYGWIDPPGTFAPILEWREFLATMQAIEPKTPDVAAAIAEAEERLKSFAEQPATQSDDDFADLDPDLNPEPEGATS